ncbi:DUF5020 family protein [Dysgonomonas sp. 25]|uniref:DUF5020 family protein n=1 Tax=Dysgonomonas sp. 25 TaxID=2302933 RepID=UPI0013D4F474|nr:DUF5020 family protein [Dysgonomonas sp. 25]NDV69520.1 DUF5020 family protein [Dysgonomonas sp. 25]
MTKKLLIIFCLLVSVGSVFAQNLQLHFDPRGGLHKDFDRNYFTATFEMFKADKWGSTFGFVDVDFNRSKGNIGLAYLEISRDQNLGNLPIRAHVEFNGGIVPANDADYSIPNAYLVGPSYSTTLFGKVNFGTYLVYKYNAFKKVSNDFQWTFTYGVNLCNDKVTLSGFFDLWTENKNRTTGKGGKKWIVLTEPQFWYNVDKNLSFGSEIEISSNFYGNKAYVNPTIAAKWNF